MLNTEPEGRDTFANMIDRYSRSIDFNDERFAYIPGDIDELLLEMESLYPRMNDIAMGQCSTLQLLRHLSFIQAQLWHLCQHAKSLDDSIATLLAVIDAERDDITKRRGFLKEGQKEGKKPKRSKGSTGQRGRTH